MKTIQMRKNLPSGNDTISSAAILALVASHSPHRPITIDEMRRRVRILDALDALPADANTLVLEDADAKALAAAIDGFPWSSASRGLLTIIDDVLKAETLPPPMRLVEKE